MYKCEENNPKGEEPMDSTDGNDRKKLKMAIIDNNRELNIQDSGKYGDDDQEGSGGYEKDLGDNEKKHDYEEGMGGIADDDMEEPTEKIMVEMDKGNDQSEDDRDQNDDDTYQTEEVNDQNENVTEKNEENVDQNEENVDQNEENVDQNEERNGQNDEIIAKAITQDKETSKSEPQCIEGIKDEEECKTNAQSWCDQQKCKIGHTGKCQYKIKDDKCCRKYTCVYKVNFDRFHPCVSIHFISFRNMEKNKNKISVKSLSLEKQLCTTHTRDIQIFQTF